MIERWIVEEFDDDYEDWFTWGGKRFSSLHDAKQEYDEYKRNFHYTPCFYRFCRIVIQPETVINKQVLLTNEEINLTTDAETQTMKFT